MNLKQKIGISILVVCTIAAIVAYYLMYKVPSSTDDIPLYGYGIGSWIPNKWGSNEKIGSELSLSYEDCAIKCRDTPTCMSATRIRSYPKQPGFETMPCQLFNKQIENSQIIRDNTWETEVIVRSNTIPEGATLINF